MNDYNQATVLKGVSVSSKGDKMNSKRSPLISKIKWGKVWVEGYNKPFKDVKLFPGGARTWDWRETGTHHTPGIQTADVVELVEKGAKVIVLSTGFHERLEVSDEALKMLDEAKVKTSVLDSERAVERYNALVETEEVGALIHSTC